MYNIIQDLKHNLVNLPGWRTNRKIIVFESDDWGSIRLPDVSLYEAYKNRFPDYIQNPYLRYDSLASSEDLNHLFELLASFKDQNGKNPSFTFNTVVANPDFEKIKGSDFQSYYHEPFTTTLDKYSKHNGVFQIWEQAIKEKLMLPQFHGREHVNVPIWLDLLQSGDSNVLDVFDFGTWSLPNKVNNRINIQASLDWEKVQPKKFQEEFISEGLTLFESIFKFKSTTMIPNNYIIDFNLFPILQEHGVKTLQGMKYHKLPIGNTCFAPHQLVRRVWGKSESFPILNLVRNCQFEPSQTNDHFDDVGHCLRCISNSFFWNKPAVIDTHRLNYVGVYDINNRDKNLKNTALLLRQILQRWPDVEFMTSSDLASLNLS